MKDIERTLTVAEMLLKIKAVTFRFDPPYTYTTGLISPIYTDNRRIMSFPDVRRKIVNYYFELMANEIGLNDIDYLSGTSTAGIPIAAFIAEKLDIPMIYVRASNKQHGLGKKIEGYLVPKSKVVIIEDMYSTGESAIHNAENVRLAGGIVKYSLATMSYNLKVADENFKKHKLHPLILTTGKIIVEIAQKKKILTLDQKHLVDQWFRDPNGWSKKYLEAKEESKGQ